MAASRASASAKSERGISRHATPRRAATSSARISGRLAITRTGSTLGRRPSATASSTASRFEPLPGDEDAEAHRL